MLKDCFPAIQAPLATTDVSESEEILTLDLDDDIDVENQEPPEDTTLINLSQLDQVLCGGPGFEDMLEKLKTLLLPPVAQLIEDVLGKCGTDTPEISSITCLVEWELLKYARAEDLDAHGIDFILT